jgi:amidohydrolase
VQRRLPTGATRCLTAAVVLAIVAIGAGPAAAQAPDELRRAIAADYEANLGPLFRHFHANPELSSREFATAARLAAEFRALGFQVTEGVGGTGVVAVMENGPGRTVMLRADMDGLPVKEDTGLPYASTATQEDIDGVVKPVMHACGHDVHLAAIVGAARQLSRRKDQWSGTLVLIGQPAEERLTGARAMIEDGLYTRFPKPDYALAFHVDASRAAGTIEVPLAIVSSSADSVDVTVHGVGGHGAYPHRAVDPVLVAAHIVVSLQSLVSRTLNPLEPGVVTVGAIHGGTKHNIIGDRVEMQLTVRADSHEVRQQLLEGIARVARGVALSLGVPEDKLPDVVPSSTESTPPLINDAATAAAIRAAFGEHFGAAKLVDGSRDGMGAEDFAYFITPESGVKGVYFGVGGTPEAELKTAPGHHSPVFQVLPEPSITTGAEAMAVGAIVLFRQARATQ